MRIGAVIQARMSSARLPGKVLRPILGKPMLQYVIESARAAASLDDVVVATSRDATDDPVVVLCGRLGVAVSRGPLDDVVGRIVGAALERDIDVVVRISGDSPLLDPAVIDHAVSLHRTEHADLVTNVFPRSFPPGQSVEVVYLDVLTEARRRMTEPADLEHVTRFFYTNPGEAQVVNFTHAPPLDHVHLAVDTDDDLARIETILRRMARPHWTYSVDEMVALLDSDGVSDL